MKIEAFDGIRTHRAGERLEPADFARARNVVVDPSGGVARREGYRVALAAPNVRSVWSEGGATLCAIGESLVEIAIEDGLVTTRTLAGGLDASRPVAYARIGSRTYYTDGVGTGVIEHEPGGSYARTWGLPVPGLPDARAEDGGSLEAGTHQVALAYVRRDAQEGGASEPVLVELAAGGAIALALPPAPADPDVVAVRVYLSQANARVLFEATTLPIEERAVRLTGAGSEAAPIETAGLHAPPAGEILAAVSGRVLIARESVVFGTEPLSPELLDPRAFWPFEAPVTMIAESDGGAYIGTTEALYFLGGEEPEAWSLREVEGAGVRPGSLARVPSRLLGIEGLGDLELPIWTDRETVRVGLPAGQTLSLAAPRYTLEQPLGPAAGVFHRDGDVAIYLCAHR